MLFVDTSALVRAYLPDEPRHRELCTLLLEGPEPVVASELARLELASAAYAAQRAARVDDAAALVARFDADCGESGAIALVAFDAACLDEAFALVCAHRVRTLDALHLAVLTRQVLPLFGEATLVSCDEAQRGAARALGLALAG